MKGRTMKSNAQLLRETQELLRHSLPPLPDRRDESARALQAAVTPAQIILAGLDGLGVLRLPEYKRKLAESLIQQTIDLAAEEQREEPESVSARIRRIPR